MADEFGTPGLAASAPAVQQAPEPRPPVDVLAVLGFLAALLGLSLVGVVLGWLAVVRIRRSGARGTGLARAAVVLGALGLLLECALAVLYFAVLAPLVTLPG